MAVKGHFEKMTTIKMKRLIVIVCLFILLFSAPRVAPHESGSDASVSETNSLTASPSEGFTTISECRPVCEYEGTDREGWYDSCTKELLKKDDCVIKEGTDTTDLCACAEIYAPVCGANGNTYSNKCSAECAGVAVKYTGKCGEEPSTVTCDVYVDDRDCKVIKCSNGKSSIECPEPLDPTCKNYVDDDGCNVKVCEDGRKSRFCPPTTASCDKYVDDNGCVVLKCTDGRYERDCPHVSACRPICKETVSEREGWYNSCTKDLIGHDECSDCDVKCDKIGTGSEGWYSVCRALSGNIDAPTSTTSITITLIKLATCSTDVVTCKSYVDDHGCKVVHCTDGRKKIDCENVVEECRKHVDDNGCTVRVCEGGAEERYCPPSINVTECEVYTDENGCRVEKCPNEIERECPEQECKYYINEDSCKVKHCIDGTTEVNCPHPTACENVVCEAGFRCDDGRCVVECKEIRLEGGCEKKVCSDGYEETECPTGEENETEIECKRYQDENGCIVKVCANGYEDRHCPVTETVEELVCKKYTDDNGCIVRVCDDGFKSVECANAWKIEVKATDQIAKVKIKLETGDEAESSFDIDSTALEAIVLSLLEKGKITIKRKGNKIEIKSKNVIAETELDVTVEEEQMIVGNTKTKVLPDQASDKAKEVISTLNVKKISLKQRAGKTVYSVEGVRKGYMLFVIPVDVPVTTNLDAVTNNVISTDFPWWNFLVV